MKAENNDLFLGKKIRDLREYLRLSKGEFGNRIHYSNSHIGRIEKGTSQATEQIINDICHAFHVDPDYFTFQSNMSVQDALSRTNYDGLDVAQRLKKEREKKNYTQVQLSDLSGTSQAQISLIEKSEKELSARQAEKLAAALDVGEEFLLTGNLEKKDDPVNEEMIDWLWKHPEERKQIWEKIRHRY